MAPVSRAPRGGRPEDAASLSSPLPLQRVVGLGGAVLLGLGSIIGTGVFVSIGIAAEIVGPGVMPAIALAALVATCNALSSAELAAAHPVSGGTYEYAYRVLTPGLGFTAGWMFLCAKTASAATAALGLAGYLAGALNASVAIWRLPLALSAVGVVTMVVLGGMRRSNRVNAVIVSTTLTALGLLVVLGIPKAVGGDVDPGAFLLARDAPGRGLDSVLHATAIMFVAYTGYARVATMGEEVIEPERTIPRAIILTLSITMGLYLAIGFVGIATIGPEAFARATRESAAPLHAVAQALAIPGLALAVAVGAGTAMFGVLLNLLLGLSRVVLAMGRRGDLPGMFARVEPDRSSPAPAVALTALAVAGLALLRDVRVTWSFSAFAVLVYYAITNVAALRLPRGTRLYPPWVPAFGLVTCLLLAFWVDPAIWQVGVGLLVAGLGWHLVRRRTRRG